MKRIPRRPGFSLIEILVAFSIISLLLALLMPAVQKVRAAADRAACQSNLRQIGLATQHYEATLGKLPPAFEHRSTRTLYPNLQWPVLLTPYLGLEPNWRMAEEDYRQSRDAYLPTPHRGISIPLKPFQCPTDSRVSQAWEWPFLYTLAKPKPLPMTLRFALNSYLGNGGASSKLRDGTIIADGRLTLLNITDGTSNTLAFGERPPQAGLHFGHLYVGWGTSASGNGELASVIGVSDPNPYYNAVKPDELTCGPGPFPYRQPDLHVTPDCSMYQYWSLHDGGANFAFCDGSVRFLRYEANAVLPALATRAGGEVVEVP